MSNFCNQFDAMDLYAHHANPTVHLSVDAVFVARWILGDEHRLQQGKSRRARPHRLVNQHCPHLGMFAIAGLMGLLTLYAGCGWS
jgi:hypothetical protein